VGVTDQRLACPDCESKVYTASVLAVVGPKDTLGLRCDECDRPIAKVEVADAMAEVHESIAEVYDE
jgi:uncharacterized protein with PIN domain